MSKIVEQVLLAAQLITAMTVVLFWCGFCQGNVTFLNAVLVTAFGAFVEWVIGTWLPEYYYE